MPTASTAKKVTTPRKRRTRKTTVTKTLNTPVAKPIVTEEVKAETLTLNVNEEVKTVDYSKFTKLRGIDFVILPLIYLEAFVVNFLQNLDVKVPERVAIK
jgi:hypothetical protein|tara:strand:- start:43162 stop:43461 length:300 start_codon:yes stop_codon:yes gene_type:complete